MILEIFIGLFLTFSSPDQFTQETSSTYTEEDVDYMAKTMYGECRDEKCRANDYAGMRAVGHVIKNRTQERNKSVKEVVLEKNQFHVWRRSDPNYSKMTKKHPKGSIHHEIYENARMIAKDILQGTDKDITKGATYYHTKAVSPSWSKRMKQTAIIAGHVFFKRS